MSFFVFAISRSNFVQILWSWTIFNSQYDGLFKNVQDDIIWLIFDWVFLEKTLLGFFWATLYYFTSNMFPCSILCCIFSHWQYVTLFYTVLSILSLAICNPALYCVVLILININPPVTRLGNTSADNRSYYSITTKGLGKYFTDLE